MQNSEKGLQTGINASQRCQECQKQKCRSMSREIKLCSCLKGGKVLLWNQVRSRMEACYSELILCKYPKSVLA